MACILSSAEVFFWNLSVDRRVGGGFQRQASAGDLPHDYSSRNSAEAATAEIFCGSWRPAATRSSPPTSRLVPSSYEFASPGFVSRMVMFAAGAG